MLQHDLSGKKTGIAWRKVLEEVDVGVHGYLYVAELLGSKVLIKFTSEASGHLRCKERGDALMRV